MGGCPEQTHGLRKQPLAMANIRRNFTIVQKEQKIECTNSFPCLN